MVNKNTPRKCEVFVYRVRFSFRRDVLQLQLALQRVQHL